MIDSVFQDENGERNICYLKKDDYKSGFLLNEVVQKPLHNVEEVEGLPHLEVHMESTSEE